MILSKNTVNHSIEILVLKIDSSNSVKLLGLVIGNKLNFNIHINGVVTSAKLKGLGRIRDRLNVSQARMLYNSLILSQFDYCSLI